MTTDPQSTPMPESADLDTADVEPEPEPDESAQIDREDEAMTAETETPIHPVISTESRNWATFAHLSAFVMFLGVPSLLGPLVVWLAKRDDPYVEAQAKEALNFNISMLIYAIAAGISILVLVGIIALPAVFIAWFVLVIVAAIRSADGEQYRYPFTIRLVS